MADGELVQRLSAVLADLAELLRRRRVAGQEAELNCQKRLSEARVALDSARRQVLDQYARDGLTLKGEFQALVDVINGRIKETYDTQEEEYEAALREAGEQFTYAMHTAKRRREQARFEANAAYDAVKHTPRAQFKDRERQIKQRQDRILELEQQFYARLAEIRRVRERRPADETPLEDLPPGPPLDDPAKQWQDWATEVETLTVRLRKAFVPSLFKGVVPGLIVLSAAALPALPIGFASGWNPALTAVAGVVGAALAVGLLWWLWKVGDREVGILHTRFNHLLGEIESLRRRWLSQELHRSRRLQAEIKHRHQADLERADGEFREGEAEAAAQRDALRAELEKKYAPALAHLRDHHAEQVRAAEVDMPQRAADLDAARDRALAAADERFESANLKAQEQLELDWQRIAAEWRTGIERLRAEAADLQRTADDLLPAWDDPRWERWEPSERIAPIIRYGTHALTLDSVLGEQVPDDRIGRRAAPTLALPAVLAFPDRCSLLIKTSGAGRSEAVQALQTVMLRFLTSLPPGKVRFTIIDPVGLGQNFAGFMHLADFDEKLVNNRIWTEPQFIEQQLADMTSHMANVIQKYLRNEYDTIEDYNRHAGEVAEPYRILVIANFPFNFSDNAARHLTSIVTSGARCGVYVLISVDMKQRLPHGFNVSDLEHNAVKLIWKENRFICKDPQWEQCPLTLDAPPPQETFKEILHRVGERAKLGSKVEVPFEFIAPRDGQWWSKHSGSGIDVPLGRAGATKRQHLQLGKGTSQHVLIAGKTGSGKSTLMHALITNLALYYSPAEVELYLIDFKKGVEFKTYATHALPHARVVAIESEREFGLSVLQRLDVELKQRGDRFRDLNVQDLNSYREATGETLPRILLIVDEFQEFFVEDDKISQETSLLLDRLVRQGRAFGVHVHLGSQTLGGAYSLARATLGQMAIRVALQCSEADSHLILSEDNPAARLLTRPGEAIYNDANGRVEGNNLFQVVWLTDDKREDYLKKLHAKAIAENLMPATPQIVFEGNVAADVAKNHPLAAALEAPVWAEQVLAAHAWLGEAIAIKDPTSIAFRRQSGSNALMIGQQQEAALSMSVVALAALAAQHGSDPRRGSAFYILDGSPPDAPHAGYFQQAAASFPHAMQVGGIRDAGRLVGEVHDELARRQTEGAAGAAEIYLVIYDLQRFRDLRKAEDDFSFSRTEEKPSPGKQLPTILREGPALGIHTIVWSDSLNNFQRTFERSMMREFELRILFQMSQGDSSNLIDSPIAGRLGPHRAFLYSEEKGTLEKFRPYSLPSDEWLAELRTRLAQKRESNAPSVS
jgi:S-DNA-T family DNA segregation ATPase FtsK/SpoIIIE